MDESSRAMHFPNWGAGTPPPTGCGPRLRTIRVGLWSPLISCSAALPAALGAVVTLLESIPVGSAQLILSRPIRGRRCDRYWRFSAATHTFGEWSAVGATWPSVHGLRTTGSRPSAIQNKLKAALGVRDVTDRSRRSEVSGCAITIEKSPNS